jgi:hypothetical protein
MAESSVIVFQSAATEQNILISKARSIRLQGYRMRMVKKLK